MIKNISDKLIYLSKEKYNEGPKKLSNEEILVMENTILENISRLEKKMILKIMNMSF
ncbi:hypothetical protein [Paraclostridium sp. AKS81]|uniref:hypothetical protein n=1 Tax=Paraclostridium sp. AKS81 TaxID=2876117 RepID=UPI0021E0E182|nr:hypothetical protein [Paraclostridium sp. AKS81]MCU9812349.1 hypothetical protein [Paraclostridium sp. AKS81]